MAPQHGVALTRRQLTSAVSLHRADRRQDAFWQRPDAIVTPRPAEATAVHCIFGPLRRIPVFCSGVPSQQPRAGCSLLPYIAPSLRPIPPTRPRSFAGSLYSSLARSLARSLAPPYITTSLALSFTLSSCAPSILRTFPRPLARSLSPRFLALTPLAFSIPHSLPRWLAGSIPRFPAPSLAPSRPLTSSLSPFLPPSAPPSRAAGSLSHTHTCSLISYLPSSLGVPSSFYPRPILTHTH